MRTEKYSVFSVSEYIQLEKEDNLKYEYHRGQVVALAGGSINHGLLCANVYSEIRSQLKNKNSNCKALSSEIKLHISATDSFVYPDAMVVCGDIETSEKDKNSIVNPIVIIEVLSDSTSSYDRGDKFYLYRQIPTLQEYVLIEQHKAQVEVYYKTPTGDLWHISRYTGLDLFLKLQSLNITIALSQLYFDIQIQ